MNFTVKRARLEKAPEVRLGFGKQPEAVLQFRIDDMDDGPIIEELLSLKNIEDILRLEKILNFDFDEDSYQYGLKLLVDEDNYVQAFSSPAVEGYITFYGPIIELPYRKMLALLSSLRYEDDE